MAVFTAIVTGIPLGVLAAVHHNRPADHAAMFFAVVGRAVPNIVIGPVLIIIFAVQLKLFPVVDPYAWINGPQANPGHYFSTAFLPVGEQGTRLAVPAAAVQRVRDRWCVFIPRDARTFEIRPVGRGRDLAGEVEILSGVRAGEPIVVDGAFLLKAETERSAAEGEHSDGRDD